ncbi:MAG: hypothetical protein ACMUHX_01320 [bacterium]
MSNKSKDKLRIDYFIILLTTSSLFSISTCAPLTTQSKPDHKRGGKILEILIGDYVFQKISIIRR